MNTCFQIKVTLELVHMLKAEDKSLFMSLDHGSKLPVPHAQNGSEPTWNQKVWYCIFQIVGTKRVLIFTSKQTTKQLRITNVSTVCGIAIPYFSAGYLFRHCNLSCSQCFRAVTTLHYLSEKTRAQTQNWMDSTLLGRRFHILCIWCFASQFLWNIPKDNRKKDTWLTVSYCSLVPFSQLVLSWALVRF